MSRLPARACVKPRGPIDDGRSWCHALHVSDTSSVRVGPKGRVVIPAEIRQELQIGEGSELVAMVDDGAVVLMSRSVAKARLRGMFASVRTSLADELIADRRREATDEDRA